MVNDNTAPAGTSPASSPSAGSPSANTLSLGASAPAVGIVMGSDSDWPVMEAASVALSEFDISHSVEVLSAHRMPQEMLAWGLSAADRGLRVVIAGAGGAAHLPGMLASVTPLPVIGVPVPLKVLDGMDSLLSIVQMPAGVPVATVSIGGARNAGLLAARILASAPTPDGAALSERLEEFRHDLGDQARAKGAALQQRLQAHPEAQEGQEGMAQ